MTRKRLVVGNWKMELSYKGELEAAQAIKKLLKNMEVTADVVLCPSFTSLADIKVALGATQRLDLGAQNVHWEEKGAWTGQVSVNQISPFVSWCIIGHSEQRSLTGETDQEVEAKAQLLLKHGLVPIICIGETLEEREADQTTAKITQQLQSILNKTTRVGLSKTVIAYEPIWAIGSGATPDPSDVSGIMLLMRKLMTEKFGNEVAERVRLLYGGSVKSDNVQPFVSEPGVDGVLVGGASVHPLQFVEIIKTVQAAS
ncbi:MAG: triose-phosphate isomerase [Candidatus Andersenbacteria bacterium]